MAAQSWDINSGSPAPSQCYTTLRCPVAASYRVEMGQKGPFGPFCRHSPFSYRVHCRVYPGCVPHLPGTMGWQHGRGALRGPLLHPSPVSAKKAEAWNGKGLGQDPKTKPWLSSSPGPGCPQPRANFLGALLPWLVADSWSQAKGAEKPMSSSWPLEPAAAFQLSLKL